jgi:hypothetical protein
VAGAGVVGEGLSGPILFSGGVVVARGDGGTAPRDNSVVANTFGKNQPDIFWDGPGSGHRFTPNTSVPARLYRQVAWP